MSKIIKMVVPLVVLVWVAASIGHSELFALLFTGICGAVVACVAGKHSAKRNDAAGRKPGTSGFKYFACVSGISYVIPMGIATAFYVLLSAYLRHFGDGMSLGWLMTMQGAFADVSTFFSDHVELSAGQVLLLLVATYLASCVLVSARPGKTRNITDPDAGRWLRFRVRTTVILNAGVGRYREYCGPIGAGLATLAAFTFFGTQLGHPSHDLQLRVKMIQHGYADIVTKVDEQVSEQVSTKLYAKVDKAFPSWYHDARALPTQIDDSTIHLEVHARTAKDTYGVSDPAVDRRIDREITRSNAVYELDSDWRINGPDQHPTTPRSLTLDQVRGAEAAIDKQFDTHRQKAIKLITEGPNTIVLHMESILSGKIMALTDPLTAHIPILKPVLQAFSDSIDTSLQARIEKLLEATNRSAIQDPHDLAATIEHDTDSLVTQADVTAPVQRATPQAGREFRKLRQTLDALSGSNSTIDREVHTKLAAEAAASLDPGLTLPLLPDIPDLDLPPPIYDFPYFPAYPEFPEFPEFPDPGFHDTPDLPRFEPPPVERPPEIPIDPFF
ncbi:MAG TPA: hypothetical protein VFX16_18270 [Pseudonocardiaceae bacterium]|nr:hypothetical protein [Pseudonocardiaceae bacterium]